MRSRCALSGTETILPYLVVEIRLSKHSTSSSARRTVGTVMIKSGNPAAGRADLAQVQLSSHDTRVYASLGDDIAPGADNEAVAIGSPAIGVLATLCRRHHEAAV